MGNFGPVTGPVQAKPESIQDQLVRLEEKIRQARHILADMMPEDQPREVVNKPEDIPYLGMGQTMSRCHDNIGRLMADLQSVVTIVGRL